MELQVEGAPTKCGRCQAPICLRKQVVNLALGNTDEMYCLVCIGAESERPAIEVLDSIMGYISSRECFRKEWNKYLDRSFCPDPLNCFPDACFGSNSTRTTVAGESQ